MANGHVPDQPQLVFWGERGLVATLFLDISSNGGFARWEQFLQSLSPPIPGKVMSAWAIIEPDFGQFGSPDLVAALTLDDEPLVLLLEAKRTTYGQSSWPRTRRGERGFNSKVNGQLELNHRLNLALSDYAVEVDGLQPLEEPEWVVTTPYGDADRKAPRHLRNPTVLGHVVPFVGGVPSDRYHHVIITTDHRNPLERAELDGHFPSFFDRDGTDQWDTVRRTHVHWMSWELQIGEAGAMVADGGSRCFPPTYELNRSNLRVDPQSSSESPPTFAGRPASGVSMVRLRQAFFDAHGFPTPSSTFLHFSWRRGRAVLRNYSQPERVEGRFATEGVVPCICDEVAVRDRRPFHDDEFWRRRTNELNEERPDCDEDGRARK